MKVIISKQKAKNVDIRTALRLAFALDKTQFINVLEGMGIEGIDTEEELEILAKLNETGGDKRGDLKRKSGEPVNFSVVELLQKMNFGRKHLRKFDKMKDEGDINIIN